MKQIETKQRHKPTFWQQVFSQSKVNGAAYYGEELPGTNWNWPKDTFLQTRLRKARAAQGNTRSVLN